MSQGAEEDSCQTYLYLLVGEARKETKLASSSFEYGSNGEIMAKLVLPSHENSSPPRLRCVKTDSDLGPQACPQEAAILHLFPCELLANR